MPQITLYGMCGDLGKAELVNGHLLKTQQTHSRSCPCLLALQLYGAAVEGFLPSPGVFMGEL